MFRVLRISIPFGAIHIPSLGLTQLKTVLAREFGTDARAEIHYLNPRRSQRSAPLSPRKRRGLCFGCICKPIGALSTLDMFGDPVVFFRDADTLTKCVYLRYLKGTCKGICKRTDGDRDGM